MTNIKKTIAVIIAVIAGVLFCVLLTGLHRLIGISKSGPSFAFGAYGASFFLGRWVYHIICHLVLKKKGKDEIVSGQVSDVDQVPRDKSKD